MSIQIDFNNPRVDEFGNKFWYDERGAYHREGGPAVIYSYGKELWYRHGNLHREGGPAVISGIMEEYYEYGQRHRDGGPALIYINKTEKWYWEGELHREDGPAIIHANGKEEWFLHGKRHRVGGPAIYTKYGDALWFQDGVLHREDGPVVEKDGSSLVSLDFFTCHSTHNFNINQISTDWEGKMYGSKYFLKGKPINEDLFEEVLTCPLVKVPPYIGTEVELLAKRRLEIGE